MYNDAPAKDYRTTLTQGVLALCSPTLPDCALRQALLLRLLLDIKDVRCGQAEGRVSVLARDEMLWYLMFMLENVVVETKIVGDLVRMEAGKLVWESMKGRKDDGMTKGNWIAWRVCDLLCGVGVIQMDLEG
jgi:hypothetical protein